MRWLLVFVVMFSTGVGRAAKACPPAVRLEGDLALVAEVARALVERGISTTAGDCPAIAVSLERQGKATLVSSIDERVAAREVTDVRTAATVIESWVRTDVEEPLLARRSVDDDEPPDAVAVVAPVDAKRRLEVFTLGESGLASDHTRWVGVESGACTQVGPACAGGRARFGTVADGPDEWERDMDREAVDALASLDLPLHVGRLTMSSGLGLGVGWTHTHEESSKNTKHTLGVRAQTQLSFSYPVSRSFAAEAMLAFVLAPVVHTSMSSNEPLPGEPGLFAHVGLGLRFGAP